MKGNILLAILALVVFAWPALAVQISTSGRCPYAQACSIGDTNTNSITLTTDGATLSVDVTANAAILKATTTSSATFTGADAAGAANTIYDTTGAGTVTVGSPDVTAVILNPDADVQIQNGATGNVDLSFHDYADTADDDMAHALLRTNCTTATTGAEDCDFSIGVAEAGNAADTRFAIDADDGVDIGSANTNNITWTTDGATMSLDVVGNTLLLQATGTNSPTFVGADAASPADTVYDTSGAGTVTVGSSDVTAVTITTDGNGDDEVVLPAGSVSVDEMTDPAPSNFTICGDADTVNNNTVYYGPNLTLTTTNNGLTCDINAAGNTTEATVDEPVYTNQAMEVWGMTCRNEQDANANISYTLRTAAGATVPSVTCTIADGERDCVADVQTTTDIAAAATVAIAAASTSDVGANNGFVCQIFVNY